MSVDPRTRRRLRNHPSLAIPCPRCSALPTQYCTSVQTGLPKHWPHPERKRQFRAQVLDRKVDTDANSS